MSRIVPQIVDLVRIARNSTLIDVDAQARRIADRHHTITHAYLLAAYFATVRHIAGHRLQQVKVGGAGGQLHADGGADGTLCVVRGHDGVVRVGHVADLPGGPQAATGEGLGLEDVDDVVLEKFGELVLPLKLLSIGDIRKKEGYLCNIFATFLQNTERLTNL